MDLYGNPADLVRLEELSDRHKIVVIDDASQAHGAAIRDRRTGTFGTGCFSFYGSKNMTTAEGGMITTDRADIAESARKLRQHGAEQRYYRDVLGFNFRMTNIQAAIGLRQLKRLPGLNAQRIANAAYPGRAARRPTHATDPSWVSACIPSVHHSCASPTGQICGRFERPRGREPGILPATCPPAARFRGSWVRSSPSPAYGALRNRSAVPARASRAEHRRACPGRASGGGALVVAVASVGHATLTTSTVGQRVARTRAGYTAADRLIVEKKSRGP